MPSSQASGSATIWQWYEALKESYNYPHAASLSNQFSSEPRRELLGRWTQVLTSPVFPGLDVATYMILFACLRLIMSTHGMQLLHMLY